jgi:hypothetical protein
VAGPGRAGQSREQAIPPPPPPPPPGSVDAAAHSTAEVWAICGPHRTPTGTAHGPLPSAMRVNW